MKISSTHSRSDSPNAPLTEHRFVKPLVLITTLFFLWALGVNLNDILIPHLKAAFGLSDFQSSFIQIAFFGGYFIAAFPAGWLVERVGYKRGILAGLALCATGALLFLPASSLHLYGPFLFALFVMACGQSFLEVAANPYVTILGPQQSAERRLNLAQSFNAVGAVLTPIIGAAFILTANEYSPTQLGALTSTQLLDFRILQARTVRIPYLVIAGIFVAVAVAIYFTKLPEVREQGEPQELNDVPRGWRRVFAHRQLVHGVIAQFAYVGAQVGVASFVIRFAQHMQPGVSTRPGEKWQRRAVDMRIVIKTENIWAVAFNVPIAEFHTADTLRRRDGFRSLGPDVLGAEFDSARCIANLQAHGEMEVGEALLTQSIIAGLGNVFKSEICFACRINPFRRMNKLNSEELNCLVNRARAFLLSNVGESSGGQTVTYTGMRRTTGRYNVEKLLWVYRRRGRPCHRCGTAIALRKQVPAPGQLFGVRNVSRWSWRRHSETLPLAKYPRRRFCRRRRTSDA